MKVIFWFVFDVGENFQIVATRFFFPSLRTPNFFFFLFIVYIVHDTNMLAGFIVKGYKKNMMFCFRIVILRNILGMKNFFKKLDFRTFELSQPIAILFVRVKVESEVASLAKNKGKVNQQERSGLVWDNYSK